MNPAYASASTGAPGAKHTTVLLSEAVDMLEVRTGDTVVDGTVGGAGHFERLLAMLGSDGVLIGIDLDADALERARETVAADKRPDRPRVHLVADNFRNLARVAARLEVTSIDRAVFDLGWSGYQLESGKGFSFRADEPLLMTYGEPEAGKSAAELVGSASEEELSELIFLYGEERYARRIAKGIVLARARERILTTGDLVRVIEESVPAAYKKGRLHPATRTFQALRIAVNDELGAIDEGLRAAAALLAPGGRISVITFHSIEDRVVKNLFRDLEQAGAGIVLTKKVLTPSDEEIAANPRARSAKLRVFAKLDTNHA
ncbi:MAG: 16S rRNA (cytosine(1402)-N(4))-methyltransferase RsmH [Candidatus Pacebacteria bacterium]|nr:16S rRNA (cytosine(1402)-N(4))-methyltransferase RsmH [Candidatus Paceibacterota bacterium]MBP9840594.1 16S rRNA (cytosine(1402)-N(4))-methyltransferase RsmH [Candidatus Paceibacterota bacterium]